MKILIVDDEPDLRRIATLSLTHVGHHEVFEASGGVEALRLVASVRPDVILLDMMMPSMDGPATLARLQQDPETSQIPVVFVTARAMPADIEHLCNLGAKGVLTKPFNAMSLPADLMRVLES